MGLPGTAPFGDALALRDGGTEFFRTLHYSGANATLVIVEESVRGILLPGDEVGIFSERNLLCGAGKYIGGHLAITVWGDDPLVAGLQGMRSGERYHIQVWKRGERKVYPVVKVLFESGDDRYGEDDLEIASQVKLGEEPISPDNGYTYMQVFPNPVRGEISVLPGKSLEGEAILRISDISGRLVLEKRYSEWPLGTQQNISLNSIPGGIYILQLSAKEGIWTEKIQVLE